MQVHTNQRALTINRPAGICGSPIVRPGNNDTSNEEKTTVKLSKTRLALNVLLVLLVCGSIFSLTRMTHQFPANMLLGFLPTVAWALWSRSPANRTLGGIAVICNGLLAVAGLFTLAAFFLGAMSRSSVVEQVAFFAFAVFLLVTGVLNTREAWRAFPPKTKAA